MSVYMLLDLYLRLSDLRLEDMNQDGESVALVYAEKQLRQRAEMMGARVGEVIVENDIVDGKPKPASAYKRKTITLADGKKVRRVIRPAFTRVIHRIETRQSGGFLTVDLDRAMRDPRDLEDLIDAVEAQRANVRSLSGSLQFTDGGTDSEITASRVMVAMANKSSRDTARRVAESRKRRAYAGEWGGGKRPYGFERDGITPRPSEAKEIVNATRLILGGVSLRQAVADLRERKVPTVYGGPWTSSALKDILSRARNAGIVVYDGEETEVRLPGEPLLAEDEFRAILSKLQVRRAAPGRTPKWLGSGIFRCNCGYGMQAHVQPNRPARYRCKDTGRIAGEHCARKLDELDEYVSDLVIEWCAQPVASQRLLHEEGEKIDIDALRARSVSLRQRLTEKATLNFDDPDAYTDEQLKVFTKLTNQKIREIEQQLAKAHSESPAMELVRPGIGMTDMKARRAAVADQWDALSLGQKRAILRELLDVRVLPTQVGKKRFDPSTIEITWKY